MSDDADDSVEGATEPGSPHPDRSAAATGVAVRLSPDRAVVPPECACCGDVASRTSRETRFADAGVILVPYCGACHGHVSRAATRRLSVGLSSTLLAFTITCGLPLILQPPGLAVYVAIVGASVALPFVVARARAGHRASGHASSTRAAWWRWDGVLVCAWPAWGNRLARASGASTVSIAVRDRLSPRWAELIAVLAVLATPFLYRFHFPTVRVVNVTDRPLTILVDGHRVARVDPTSRESPHAGASVRVPAGRRTLTAVDADGRVVDVASVTVQTGEEHLYAPASDGTCFWVESTGYGKSLGLGTERDPLMGDPRFWALPFGVDFWFVPAPPADTDGRSTGGLVRAIRQASCDEAPDGVR